ncbi:MAG: hypothetical protein Q9166_000275 [cf. Caloplaca sp. 2 TL-2023]
MGQNTSTTRIFGYKKWSKERDQWLQTVSRGPYDEYVAFLLRHKSIDTAPLLNVTLEILRKVLTFHAAYPFHPQAGAKLDSDAMLRAAAFLSGKAYKSIWSLHNSNGQVLTRKKIENDNRRTLFRSVAVHIQELAVQPAASDPSIRDVDKEDSKQEILDVLACIQPRYSASIASLSRQQLEPTATRLCEEEFSLLSLLIPGKDMINLLKCLIVCRFGGLPCIDMDHFDQVTKYMLNAFLLGVDGGISWEVFDGVIGHIMVLMHALSTSVRPLISFRSRGSWMVFGSW